MNNSHKSIWSSKDLALNSVVIVPKFIEAVLQGISHITLSTKTKSDSQVEATYSSFFSCQSSGGVMSLWEEYAQLVSVDTWANAFELIVGANCWLNFVNSSQIVLKGKKGKKENDLRGASIEHLKSKYPGGLMPCYENSNSSAKAKLLHGLSCMTHLLRSPLLIALLKTKKNKK